MAERDPRLELLHWYVDSLQPKLARAAETRVIAPGAAAELDRQVAELLALRTPAAGPEGEAAA